MAVGTPLAPTLGDELNVLNDLYHNIYKLRQHHKVTLRKKEEEITKYEICRNLVPRFFHKIDVRIAPKFYTFAWMESKPI